MRKIFITLFLLISATSFGQKQIDTYPVFPGTVMSDSDHVLGYHINPDGSKTTYDYDLTSLIFSDTVSIIGITKPTFDSGLATRMNALLILEIKHGGVVSAPLQINSFYRLRDSSGLAVDTFKMANRPLNHTLSGMKMISNVNTYGVAVLQAQGGQKFINGTSYDTIKAIGGTKIFEYLDVDSTWNPIWEYYPLPAINSTVNPPNLVQAVSTASLTGTYSNGANGIGATFTSTANVHIVVDGYSMNAGDRLLLTANSPTYQNGVYKVLQTGTASVAPFILVRADNYNAPWNINNGPLIPVQNGAVNAGSTWLLSAGVSVSIVGTDAIGYTKWGINNIDKVLAAGDTGIGKGIYFNNYIDSPFVFYAGIRRQNGLDKSGQEILYDTMVGGLHHAELSLAAGNNIAATSIHGFGGGDQLVSTHNDFILTANNADLSTSAVLQLSDMHSNKINVYPASIVITDGSGSSGNSVSIVYDTLSSSRTQSLPDADGIIGVFTNGKGIGITNSATSGVISQSAGKDGSYQVSAFVNVTTSTVHSFTVICSYTDETNTARTATFNFSNLAGTISPTIANAGGAVPYEGLPLNIRCKAGTSISVATAPGGTYTGVVYDIYASCVKIGKQ